LKISHTINQNYNLKSLDHIKQLIHNADAIAIFAGAGMGVDSGLEQYRGNNGLWTKQITIDGKEINYYDLMTHSAFEETPHQSWGLIASLMQKYLSTSPHSGYLKLLELVKNKEYFVVTSNIDEHFQKAGFDELRIFECHGSINYMQCTNVKEREIWLTPKIEIDSSNLYALDPLPTCPDCGSYCRPNVLLFYDWFWVSTKSVHQQLRYNKWYKLVKEKYSKIVAIEIGAGKTINTVRKASEYFASDDIPLIRCNPNDSDTSRVNHISLPWSAKEFIEKL